MLSLCIPTYKESHGGVHVPLHKYTKLIDPVVGGARVVSLEAVWQRPSGFKHVINALAWMDSICTSINQSDQPAEY